MQYSESEEKLLARIASLYLILQKLGFSRTQVEECLLNTAALDLDQVLDWVRISHRQLRALASLTSPQIYLRHTPSDQFTGNSKPDASLAYGEGYWPDDQLSLPAKETKNIATPSASATPPPAATTAVAPVLKPDDGKVSPKRPGLLDIRNNDSESDDEAAEAPSNGNGKAVNGKFALPAEDLDDMEDNPDAAYISTKMQITSLQRRLGLAGKGGKKGAKAKPKAVALTRGNEGEMQRLGQLEDVLKRIQQMYLFDQKRAEAAYLVERARVDKLDLAERLSGRAKERQQAAQTQIDGEPDSEPPPIVPDVIAEAGDEQSLLGNMLDEPAEPVSSADVEPELNSRGTIIIVRDMSLPKNFTGKTPRSLLEDTIRRLDKFGKSTYRVISRSRAVRAVVTIRWDSGKSQQFGMEDEACENQDQAFHYVSTLALFALAGDTSPQRLLPAKFRELWDELAVRSKEAEDRAYRDQLQVYRRLAEGRRASVPPTPEISPTIRPKPVNGSSAVVPEVDLLSTQGPKESPDQLISELLARQSSHGYQIMLVSRDMHDISIIAECHFIAATPRASHFSVSRPHRLNDRCQPSHCPLRRDGLRQVNTDSDYDPRASSQSRQTCPYLLYGTA